MHFAGAARRRRFWGGTAISVLWVATLATGELLARRFGGFAIANGQLATVVAPHVEYGTLTMETLHGVTIWHRPHPDRPLPRQEKEGFRIVVLGDSVLEPAGLNDADGAARLLERELNARLDAGPYEVVNLSEGGWNTVQEEQVLFREGLPLSPDLVLVGVSPNDTQEFAFRGGQLFEVRFLRDLAQRPTGGVLGILAAHSYLYNLFWLRWKHLVYSARGAGEAPEVHAIVEPLRRMVARSAAQGVTLALLCLPEMVRDRFDSSRDRCPLGHLVDWASAQRIPLLDPIPMYAPYSNCELRLDHIHLSPLGHRVLGRALFNWLVNLRLVPYSRILPATGNDG